MENSVSIKIHKIDFFSYIFNFYLILLVFDPMRESIDLGGVNTLVSLFRDMCIFFLFFYIVLLKSKKRFSSYFLLLFLSLFIKIVLSFFVDIDRLENFGLLYGIARGYIVCYVIYNLCDFYCFDEKFLCRYFVILSVLNFFITIFIFFLKPELISGRNFYMRICIGNPSMQSILYVCGFILCFCFNPFKSAFINILVDILLLIATSFTITSTAFIVLALIFVFTFFTKKYFLKWLIILFFIFILGLLGIKLLQIDISSFFNFFMAKCKEVLLVFSKYFNFEVNVTSQYKSFNIREEQIQRFIESFTFEKLFFGDGIFSMINQRKYMIENTYIALIRDFGLLGFFTFLIFYLKEFFSSTRNYLRYKKYSCLLILFAIGLYGITLYIPAANSMLIQFYLSYSIAKWNDCGDKK